VYGGASEREREREREREGESLCLLFLCVLPPDCSTRLVCFFCSVADAAARI
jgi:hypothetical protein